MGKGLVDGTGHPAFLLGRIYPAGTAFYFPVVLMLKSSLPLLLFLAAGVWLLLAGMSTRLNIGVRHELAMYPFAVLLTDAKAPTANHSRVHH